MKEPAILPRQLDQELKLHMKQGRLGKASKAEASEKAFKNILRSLNLKVTQQRMLLLECLHKGTLQEGQVHRTAQDIFETVREKDPTLGFATVYRFLRKLTDTGHVTELKIGSFPARYEMASAYHHDHLTCTRCGKICEFENLEIENLQIQVAKSLGFRLTGHVLELYGVCFDCEKNSNRHS